MSFENSITKKERRSSSFAPMLENFLQQESAVSIRPCGSDCHCPASKRCDCVATTVAESVSCD